MCLYNKCYVIIIIIIIIIIIYFLFGFNKNTSITDRCFLHYYNWLIRKSRSYFYKGINMYLHVTSVFRATYYYRLKALLIQETLVTVVHVFVGSRVDYCNYLIYGIYDNQINRL